MKSFQEWNLFHSLWKTLQGSRRECLVPNSTWKKNELSWASIGAKRNHFEAEDCSHPIFSIECKQRTGKNYPKTLKAWFAQAQRNAPEGKIPLLAIHLTGERRTEDLVIMRRADFEDLFGTVG
jgi:hypothetical protein